MASLSREQWWLLSDLSLSNFNCVSNVDEDDMEALEDEWMVKSSKVGPMSFAFQVTPRGLNHATQWRKQQVQLAVSKMEKAT